MVVNERERMSDTRKLKKSTLTHLPAPFERVLPTTADALLEAAFTATDDRSSTGERSTTGHERKGRFKRCGSGKLNRERARSGF